MAAELAEAVAAQGLAAAAFLEELGQAVALVEVAAPAAPLVAAVV